MVTPPPFRDNWRHPFAVAPRHGMTLHLYVVHNILRASTLLRPVSDSIEVMYKERGVIRGET